jgi:hypothetical protein
MIINKISIQKSKTIGFLDQYNKTKFKKIQIGVDAELGTDDDPIDGYKKLSLLVEDFFAIEAEKK